MQHKSARQGRTLSRARRQRSPAGLLLSEVRNQRAPTSGFIGALRAALTAFGQSLGLLLGAYGAWLLAPVLQEQLHALLGKPQSSLDKLQNWLRSFFPHSSSASPTGSNNGPEATSLTVAEMEALLEPLMTKVTRLGSELRRQSFLLDELREAPTSADASAGTSGELSWLSWLGLEGLRATLAGFLGYVFQVGAAGGSSLTREDFDFSQRFFMGELKKLSDTLGNTQAAVALLARASNEANGLVGEALLGINATLADLGVTLNGLAARLVRGEHPFRGEDLRNGAEAAAELLGGGSPAGNDGVQPALLANLDDEEEKKEEPEPIAASEAAAKPRSKTPWEIALGSVAVGVAAAGAQRLAQQPVPVPLWRPLAPRPPAEPAEGLLLDVGELRELNHALKLTLSPETVGAGWGSLCNFWPGLTAAAPTLALGAAVAPVASAAALSGAAPLLGSLLWLIQGLGCSPATLLAKAATKVACWGAKMALGVAPAVKTSAGIQATVAAPAALPLLGVGCFVGLCAYGGWLIWFRKPDQLRREPGNGPSLQEEKATVLSGGAAEAAPLELNAFSSSSLGRGAAEVLLGGEPVLVAQRASSMVEPAVVLGASVTVGASSLAGNLLGVEEVTEVRSPVGAALGPQSLVAAEAAPGAVAVSAALGALANGVVLDPNRQLAMRGLGAVERLIQDARSVDRVFENPEMLRNIIENCSQRLQSAGLARPTAEAQPLPESLALGGFGWAKTLSQWFIWGSSAAKVGGQFLALVLESYVGKKLVTAFVDYCLPGVGQVAARIMGGAALLLPWKKSQLHQPSGLLGEIQGDLSKNSQELGALGAQLGQLSSEGARQTYQIFRGVLFHVMSLFTKSEASVPSEHSDFGI